MSLLHLLGIEDNVNFDGKSYDKVINNITSLTNGKYDESTVEMANDCLSDINAEATSLDALEDISNNLDNLVNSTENLLHSHIAVYKILKQISEEASKYCDSNNKQHIQDTLHCLAEQAKDGMNYLNQELNIEIETKYVFGTENNNFIKYCGFDFIPETAILNRSDKSGTVCYVSGNWEFILGTRVDYYSGLKMTPKSIQFKHFDFCKCYDKIIEVGLDPHNLNLEDLQLLKILDNSNIEVYNLFVNKYL